MEVQYLDRLMSNDQLCIWKPITWDFSKDVKVNQPWFQSILGEIVLAIGDALFPLAHVDGRSTHNYRENADKDEMVSGASINQGVMHSIH